MKENIMALCDLETAYAVNFMEYVNRRSGNIPFEIHAFTSVEQLRAFSGEHPVELLLISERAMTDEVESLGIGQILILTEGVPDQDRMVYPAVNKYQPSSLLIREVLADYAEGKKARGANAMFRGNTQILTVLSADGGADAAGFAFSAGLLLGEQCPSLLIDFSPCSALRSLFLSEGRPGGRDLADVVYYLRQGRENCMDFLNALAERYESLYFLPPAGQFSDLQDAEGSDWQGLLAILKKESGYERIVLLPDPAMKGLPELLRISDTVFLLGGENPIVRAKEEQLERMLKRSGSEVPEAKLIRSDPAEAFHLPADSERCRQELRYGTPAEFTRGVLQRAGCM